MYGQDTYGTLMNDIRTLHSDINEEPANDDVSACKYNKAKLKPLDKEMYHALVTFAANNRNKEWAANKKVLLHMQHAICGQQYQRSTVGKKNCVIFSQPKAEQRLVPGVIWQIFLIPHMTMLKYTITWYFIKFGRGCTMFQPALYSQSNAAMEKISGCALSLKLYLVTHREHQNIKTFYRQNYRCR